MANQLSSLLTHWYPARDTGDWVLGTVYRTEGPCYRKAGAMMLFNSLGQQFGMLSGGCLESDIGLHARKVMQDGRSRTLCYDGSDEDDLSFRLGIGCGGTVYILLQPVHRDNGYQGLARVHQALVARQPGIYRQWLPGPGIVRSGVFDPWKAGEAPPPARLVEQGDDCRLDTPVAPDPHLLVIGGGIDARPVVAMARQLGWRISVWDPRPANARAEFFGEADELLGIPVDELGDWARAQRIDAAVLMSHSVPLDAAALAQLNGAPMRYLALLGPVSRKAQVVKQARLGAAGLLQPLHGPAGLALGGELPESIALSILSQCHATLHRAGECLEEHSLSA